MAKCKNVYKRPTDTGYSSECRRETKGKPREVESYMGDAGSCSKGERKWEEIVQRMAAATEGRDGIDPGFRSFPSARVPQGQLFVILDLHSTSFCLGGPLFSFIQLIPTYFFKMQLESPSWGASSCYRD